MYMNTSWTKEYAIKITLLFTKIFLILFVHNVFILKKDLKYV